MDTNNFQRVGSPSNAFAGNEFEKTISEYFASRGVNLTSNFSVSVGAFKERKARKFDLGSEDPPLLVECKSHNWTVSGNIPSAKITVWNEAMYYFHIAPSKYRKILFVLKSLRDAETLAAYYVRCYGHLIPRGVEIWEYDAQTSAAVQVR